MQSMQPSTSTHRSLQRAIAILREFSEPEPALTVSEISRRLGLHKSTVSRILGTLLEEGMVWHSADSGRYSLGMALVGMAGVALGQIDVRAAAIPHIEQLAAATNETISVAVRRDRAAVIVAHLPSTHSVRHVLWIGRRLPLRTTASGKALLAATRRGYAEESDEFEIGTAAIAAPILDHTGATVGALSISGPSARFDTEARSATARLLIETAEAVASDLGKRRPATSQKESVK